MKYFVLSLSLFFVSLTSFSQVNLVIDALKTDYHNVPREVPTNLIITRSLFNPALTDGYTVQAGDNTDAITQHNLDGAQIIGNKLICTTSNIVDGTSRHGLMLGNNINYHVYHNYFDRLGYSATYKNGGEVPMEWTDGAHAYNIQRNCRALLIKGMSGVRVYNNTFYAKEYGALYHIRIEQNTKTVIDVPATNTKIKNNIFYQEKSIPAIQIEQASCLEGLECDYNVYYCTNRPDRKPYFDVGSIDDEGNVILDDQGEVVYTRYTWDQWRALGYDTHSVIMDPKFIDTENFVPVERLNFGVDLGTAHATGLATTAKWELGKYPYTAEQNGEWQVGAVLYGVTTSIKNPDTSANSSDKSELIIIYPNPNNGVFTVELPIDLAEVANHIHVVSITGKIIYNGTIPMGEYSMKIDLSNVPPGIYILSAVNSNLVKKIRIQ